MKNPVNPLTSEKYTPNDRLLDAAAMALRGGGGHGSGSGGGGKPDGAGSKKGDLFGDQYVLLRDVDPSDGGGSGEPVLDANGNPILVGTNGLPIFFVANIDGDYEIPADQVVFTQTVELERANVARAPDKVMEKSLGDALGKIEAATALTLDAAGRIVCDGATIDSPLENLALYKYLMTAGGQSSWPAVTQFWPDALQALLGSDPASPRWDPSSLLGAAFSKEAPISLDAVLYENTVLGVNKAITVDGQAQVDYFDFCRGTQESYSYDRGARYEGVWLQWYADTDGDSTTLELVKMSLLEAVFKNAIWTDSYLTLTTDGSTFQSTAADNSGVNDFAQAADDARAVINFLHESGAVQIASPEISGGELPVATVVLPSDSEASDVSVAHENEGTTIISGTTSSDLIVTGGGSQYITTGNGHDEVRAGGGPDVVDAGNGKDLIMGEGGPDVLMGGNGNDVLIAGTGHDTLTGGHGADIFVYTDIADARNQQETITDFNVSVDRIDFSELCETLHFSQGQQANAVWVEQHTQDTVIFLDTDGNVAGSHPAELSIVLTGVNAACLDIENFIV